MAEAPEWGGSKDNSADYAQDELIVVKLPRHEYEIMREMIKKQEALGWLGKYFRNVVLVGAGGFLTLFTFWDYIKHFLQGVIK